jgi:tetratricopeptide (TPR) repeat protein
MKALNPLLLALMLSLPAMADQDASLIQPDPLGSAAGQTGDFKFSKMPGTAGTAGAAALLTQGQNQLKSRNYDSALSAYQQAADAAKRANNPALEAQARAGLASVYAERARYSISPDDADHALAEATKAARLNPNDPAAVAAVGHAQIAQMKPEAAVNTLNAAVNMDPKNCDALVLRGIAHSLAGDYDAGLADHNKAIELCPAMACAYNARGIDEACKGDDSSAQNDYQKALSLDAKDPTVPYNLSLIVFNKGDVAGAQSYTQKAFDLEPKFAMAQSNLATCQFSQGFEPKARDSYGAAIKLDPRLNANDEDIKIPYSFNCHSATGAAFNKMRAALGYH